MLNLIASDNQSDIFITTHFHNTILVHPSAEKFVCPRRAALQRVVRIKVASLTPLYQSEAKLLRDSFPSELVPYEELIF